LVQNHLAGVDGIWIALEQEGNFARAERLGLEFAEDVRLLEDIGWRPHEVREVFELTMPVEDLLQALSRLHHEADRVLTESAGERRSREADEEVNQRLQAGLEACKRLLVALDERAGS
jgi:hypothetical protein